MCRGLIISFKLTYVLCSSAESLALLSADVIKHCRLEFAIQQATECEH